MVGVCSVAAGGVGFSFFFWEESRPFGMFWFFAPGLGLFRVLLARFLGGFGGVVVGALMVWGQYPWG